MDNGFAHYYIQVSLDSATFFYALLTIKRNAIPGNVGM